MSKNKEKLENTVKKSPYKILKSGSKGIKILFGVVSAMAVADIAKNVYERVTGAEFTVDKTGIHHNKPKEKIIFVGEQNTKQNDYCVSDSHASSESNQSESDMFDLC